MKAQVLIGSLHFEKGTFEKGETFWEEEKRVKQFSPNDIKIIGESPRPVVAAVLKKFKNKEITGVEIGVGKAEQSLEIVQLLNMNLLYLVDPYVPYIDEPNEKPSNFSSFRAEAQKRMMPYPQVRWIFKMSDEACNDVPDNSLDFVYIDGNHSYDFVKADIEKWYPKLKIGGIMGGHDYTKQLPGVITAVDELKESTGMDIRIEATSPLYGQPNNEWWFVKTSKEMPVAPEPEPEAEETATAETPSEEPKPESESEDESEPKPESESPTEPEAEEATVTVEEVSTEDPASKL